MTREDRERLDRARQDERIAREAALAAEYQRQHPDMSRDEALRLAIKHVALDMPALV